MSKYTVLHNDNKAELNMQFWYEGELTVCVCEENGCCGSEFMYFTKQDLLDMLALFEEQEKQDNA